MNRSLASLFALLALSSACGDPSRGGPEFTLTVAEGGQTTTALPWPSDLFLDDNGHVAPASLPLDDSAQTTSILKDLATIQDGFGVTTGAYFPVGRFPAQAGDPAIAVDEASLLGHVHLYQLSCKNGVAPSADELPIYVHLRAQDKPQRVYVRPQFGVVLREQCTYAYVVTRDVTSNQGALGPSADLEVLLGGAAPEARLQRAYEVYAPLRARLAAGPITPAQVAAATVFTTHSLTKDYVAARAALLAGAKPKATVQSVWARTATAADDGNLEQIFGTPAVEQPGMDNPGGMAHAAIEYVIHGTFLATDFLGGSTKNAIGIDATAVGQVEYDAAGAPKAKGTVLVPFTIVIPTGADLTKLKYAVVQHGLGSSRLDMMTVASTLATKGIASMVIDLPFHGARSAGAVDKLTELTSAMTPDGFAETDSNASLGFFAVSGNAAAGIPNLSPRAVRSHFFQSVNDIEAAFLLLSDGDLSAIFAREPRLATLKFDGSAVGYVSESFGSMIGTIVAAVQPNLVGAVLDVGGGGLLFPLLLNSATFAPLFGTLLDSNFGTNAAGGVDPPSTDWAYNLGQSLLDLGDALAFSPYVIPPQSYGTTGDMPCHVLQLSAWRDELVPNPANIALARGLGLDPVQLADGVAPDLLDWGATTKTGAVSGNGAAGRTAAFVQFHEAAHGMISVRGGFHRYDLSSGAPPFPMLTTPVPIANPTDRVHALTASFMDAVLKGAVPEVK